MRIKSLPMAMPNGALMPFMSAQRANQVGWTVFEMSGGVERLAHIANKDDEGFKWFIEKYFVKVMPRNLNVEATANGVDALVKKRRELSEAEILDITPTEVEYAD